MAPVDPADTHLIYLYLRSVRELSQGIHIPSPTPAALIQIENHSIRPLWTTGVPVVLEILHLVDVIFNIQLYHNSPAGICSSLVPFLQDHGSFLENIFDRPRHGCVAPMMMHFSSHDVGCHLQKVTNNPGQLVLDKGFPYRGIRLCIPVLDLHDHSYWANITNHKY